MEKTDLIHVDTTRQCNTEGVWLSERLRPWSNKPDAENTKEHVNTHLKCVNYLFLKSKIMLLDT